MITPQDIKSWITQSLNVNHIEVDGDGQHFFAEIVSNEFTGLNRIQRHKKVYQALGNKMQSEIHALSMKTLTPEEAEKKESN